MEQVGQAGRPGQRAAQETEGSEGGGISRRLVDHQHCCGLANNLYQSIDTNEQNTCVILVSFQIVFLLLPFLSLLVMLNFGCLQHLS